jgi:hypothetical protein
MTTISREQTYSKGSIISPTGNFEWEGQSDGNEGIVKLTIDGKNTQTIRFTKDELEDLFNQTIVKMPLDKRLIMDFMSDNDEYVNPFKKIETTNKKKIKSRKNKNKNKNKKNIKSRKNK